MPKYYVQCGPVSIVLTASCAESAALAALDRSLQEHVWIYDDAGLSNHDRRTHLMLESLLHLAPTIRISEKGFQSQDYFELGTPETIDQWHRLMEGMNRLFMAAGLPPRSMASIAGCETGENDVSRPEPIFRLPR